jgi:hypothetical protein
MMTDRSHVTRRVARSIDRDFPTSPTLPGTTVCDGMAFMLDPAAPPPDLRPLRDMVDAMWRGALSADAEAPDVLLVLLARPMALDAPAWPSALPLVTTSPGTLASFVRGPTASRAPATTDPRHVELWWGGRAHRIAIATFDPVAIDTLWDMPRLTVHRPAALRRTSVRHDAATEDAPGAADDLAPIGRARIPMLREGPGLFDAMNADLRDRDARIRLPAIFRQAWLSLFTRRVAGAGGAAPRQAPRAPGVLANLAGWLRWHTPFGLSLRRGYEERLQQVEKMIASGDFDSALRLALKLGSGNPQQGKANRFPNQLPAMRARLDFELSQGFAAPILGGAAFFSLQARYVQLAEQLERSGDHRRAAYIHSQLLNSHHRAVLALESGGLFREAAKLALDSKQPAALTIRMFFQAGEHDTALALARRTACFDQLAEDSRGKDPVYHAYVVKAWTDMLLATGQPLRALQVTDQLAELADAGDPLLAARRGWLGAAIDSEDGDGFGGELSVRALLDAGAARYPAVLAWLEAVMRDEVAEAGPIMLDLLGHMARLADPKHAEQAAFWRESAQPVIESFARAFIATVGNRIGAADLQGLHTLLGRAQLRVLDADIRKLGKLPVNGSRPGIAWHVPPATAQRPPVRHACLLGNGTMLIWRESRLLQLLDRHGGPLWQQNVSDVVGLVAIGTSPHVVIIQAQRDGSRLLTRFASHARTFHAIGKVNLVAHHDMTSESQWLVQIGGDIGALDLVRLCAATPAIEFLWSCALTDRVRAIAFAHFPHAPSWLTFDISEDRYGVLEIWSLRATGELTTHVCRPVQHASLPQFIAPTGWCWFSQETSHRICTVTPATRWMQIWPWSEDQEHEARMYAVGRIKADMAGVDIIQSCDFDRPYIGFKSPPVDEDADKGGEAETSIMTTSSNATQMTLRHDAEEPLTCLARGHASSGKHRIKGAAATSIALFADERGRLFIVDSAARRVTVI